MPRTSTGPVRQKPSRKNAALESLLQWLSLGEDDGGTILDLATYASEILYDAEYHEKVGDDGVAKEADATAYVAFDIWDKYRKKIIQDLKQKLGSR